jgi:hypothetical protein
MYCNSVIDRTIMDCRVSQNSTFHNIPVIINISTVFDKQQKCKETAFSKRAGRNEGGVRLPLFLFLILGKFTPVSM